MSPVSAHPPCSPRRSRCPRSPWRCLELLGQAFLSHLSANVQENLSTWQPIAELIQKKVDEVTVTFWKQTPQNKQTWLNHVRISEKMCLIPMLYMSQVHWCDSECESSTFIWLRFWCSGFALWNYIQIIDPYSARMHVEEVNLLACHSPGKKKVGTKDAGSSLDLPSPSYQYKVRFHLVYIFSTKIAP